MKSFCIKIDSEDKKNFLLEQLNQIELDDFYISDLEFRVYKNVIVHYTGKNVIFFEKNLSEVIANCIQHFYEEKILEKIIRKNYFYLSEDEQDSIIRISVRILNATKETEDFGKEILQELIYEYIDENKKMILDGFIIFRTKEYIEILDYISELAVTSYLNLIQY
jgi:hypothetical protein